MFLKKHPSPESLVDIGKLGAVFSLSPEIHFEGQLKSRTKHICRNSNLRRIAIYFTFLLKTCCTCLLAIKAFISVASIDFHCHIICWESSSLQASVFGWYIILMLVLFVGICRPWTGISSVDYGRSVEERNNCGTCSRDFQDTRDCLSLSTCPHKTFIYS